MVNREERVAHFGAAPRRRVQRGNSGHVPEVSVRVTFVERFRHPYQKGPTPGYFQVGVQRKGQDREDDFLYGNGRDFSVGETRGYNQTAYRVL